MAHFAFLDENNVVTEVIVGVDDDSIDLEKMYGEVRNQVCKKTSSHTLGGIHYEDDGNTPSGKPQFRKNYAGIGFTYDAGRDAFIPPKEFPSWILNEETCWWEPPVPHPADGKQYFWDEATGSWVEGIAP